MTGPARPTNPQYKGEDLDAARGPGLGCFWVQVVLLAITIVLTPVSAFARWSPIVTVVLMVLMIVLLLLVGQTSIFLLRIVAAERGQRRPLASRTKTVGEIESAGGQAAESPGHSAEPPESSAEPSPKVQSSGEGDSAPGVRE